ncbi:histone H1.1, embryonic-like [Danaus plexippus]|uniref:histone H1.1, embryonic-like n=1 Tax=Danaus plexippus TaxID=13037 RepID=UPI002AB0338C|nr:histone H1.1, embryonic-like [Danaus plexippus]
MSEESDVEMKSAPMRSKRPPASPTADTLKEPKRLTTKEMIKEALTELRSRKGTSLFAIKKYLELKYNVDVEKIKHIIKKYIKTSVEDGTIVQTKGVGASGSFKLVEKEKKEKKVKKDKKEKKEKKGKVTENTENADKKIKPKTKKESKDKDDGTKKVKIDTKKKKEKKETVKGTVKEKKTDKVVKTPAKKRTAMMKRKSIGSIIKPPKMKPAKAIKG